MLLYPFVAMETHFFTNPLPSKRYFIFVYLAVFAQQRVYISQYVKIFTDNIYSAVLE
jgi:hypothetical protein